MYQSYMIAYKFFTKLMYMIFLSGTGYKGIDIHLSHNLLCVVGEEKEKNWRHFSNVNEHHIMEERRISHMHYYELYVS